MSLRPGSDAREADKFSAGTIKGARNIPYSRVKGRKGGSVIKAAKNDRLLPMHDHNTRVIVFGASGERARHVASALCHNAFHNVSFFSGTFAEAHAAADPAPPPSSEPAP